MVLKIPDIWRPEPNFVGHRNRAVSYCEVNEQRISGCLDWCVSIL